MHIEDYIEILAGHNTENKIILDAKDIKLIKSLSSQTLNHIAFTDRQHTLAKRKIIEYKDQLIANGFNDYENHLDNLRHPYREIDRRKTVSLITIEVPDLFDLHKKTMLAIKFPYAKKMIKHIEFIKSLQNRIFGIDKLYDSKTKTHYLEVTEKNIYKIVDRFKDLNFEIDKELIEQYHVIKNFVDTPSNFMPGIYNYTLKNVHKNLENYVSKTIGNPSPNTLALYYDRRDCFGLKYFDQDLLDASLSKFSSLSKKIIHSDQKSIFLSRNEFTHQDICTSLIELKRFPILVVLKKNLESIDLLEMYEGFKKIIQPKNISVLFRLDNINSENTTFNQVVKELFLNNPVTEQTQIVFLNKDKIPKPLVTSQFKANVTVLMESFRYNRIINSYYESSELVLHYDTIPSTWAFKAS